MNQGAISCGSRPGFCLCRLRFRWRANGQQVGLPDFQGVGNDLQPVIKHSARVGMVVVLRGRKLLNQLSVAIQRTLVEISKLRVR